MAATPATTARLFAPLPAAATAAPPRTSRVRAFDPRVYQIAVLYKAMFAEQVRKEDMRVVFLEYAWDMAWCDPCAVDPLSADELRKLGASWAEEAPGQSGPQNVFVSRLHVRYDAERFPRNEDRGGARAPGRLAAHTKEEGPTEISLDTLEIYDI